MVAVRTRAFGRCSFNPLGGFKVKRLISASCVLAFFVAGSVPAAARVSEQCPVHPLYAAQAHAREMFAGSSPIPRSEYVRQIELIRCQRDLFDQGVVRRDDRKLHGEHAARVAAARQAAAASAFRSGVASYYDDTALGLGTHYGFAACGAGVCVPRGTRIEFCYASCVVAVRDDSGPYVAGRDFDLNMEAAQAVGMTGAGVVTLRWRIVG